MKFDVLSESQVEALAETSRLFTAAFNAVCRAGWNGKEKNGVKLHHLTYRPLKTEYPALVSDLHIQARMKATEAVKSAFTRLKQGRKAGCPNSRLCPPRYNVHTFKVDWESQTVRLSTTRGKQTIRFNLPPSADGMKNYKVCTADLIHYKDKWWLHVIIELPTPKIVCSDHVVGIDFGVCRPAVTSDWQFFGERRWRDIEAKIFRQKRQCQSKGSKSAKRRLRILRGRQRRFRRDCDHVISRRIVDATPVGGTIALENLTGIRQRMKGRKRQRRRLHGWSFAQVRGFTEYKAEAKGCETVGVDPRHTSQTCSRCGHCHRSNRRSQALFVCRKCGYTANADGNAGCNIRNKLLVIRGISPPDRLSSTSPTAQTSQCGRATA